MSAPSFTYSGNVYTGAAAGTIDFALTSPTGNPIAYLEPSHIHVYKSSNQGSTWTELTRPSQWNFVSAGTVARLVTGIAAGDWIKVQRITPSTSAYVTFQSSSLLTADQLNDDTLFNTYLNQERYDQGDQSAVVAAAASATATSASTAATAATATANSAAASAAAATSTANAASSTASTAAANAATALSQSNTALSQSAAAVSTANNASSTAASASSVAAAADAKADSAITAISTSAVFTPVANVAAIPVSPTGGQAIQVTDSTGIQSFTPLNGLPPGFVGDPGLSARIQYSAATSSWVWFGYFASDSDTRYLKQSGGTLTGQLRGDDSALAATPGYAFDGDPDTGMGRLGANELALITGGVARLTFDAAGNGAFTGPVTIPNGSTVTGYLDAATAASTYLTTAAASSTYQTQAAMSGYLATSAIGTTVQSYDADTAKTNVAQTFTAGQRGAINTLTDSATITADLANGNNFSVTLGGNRTLANPTYLGSANGQSGVFIIKQDTTGGRTLSFGSHWKFPGGTVPTLTTAANAVDIIAYYVESATRITARFIGDVK
ncbi:MAG: hypothetical protein FJ211_09270 [Ignavibacteria bacterium]|nr:hypothetical protein [Ignavibacteria bacterium]